MNDMFRMMAGGGSEEERGSGYPKGLAFGTVQKDHDDSGLGRVRVKLELHKEGEKSFWARLAVPMAGDQTGTWFRPHEGDEVLVGFIGEDASHPVIVGAVWNSKAPPPEFQSNAKNEVRVIRTPAGHELRFNDSSDGEIELQMKGGSRLFLKAGEATLEDRQGNTVSMKDGTLTLKATTRIELSAPIIEIKAQTQLKLNGGGSCKMEAGLVEIN